MKDLNSQWNTSDKTAEKPFHQMTEEEQRKYSHETSRLLFLRENGYTDPAFR